MSVQEILSAIQNNLKKSAPGLHSMHPFMLKNCHHNAIVHLTNLFNRIKVLGQYPWEWLIVIILPILKPNSDLFNLSSYRPIFLTSVIKKTFKKLSTNDLFGTLNRIISSPHFNIAFAKEETPSTLSLTYNPE